MKYLFFALWILLVIANLALLWQTYRKIKNTSDEDTVTDLKPYIIGRLIAFTVNCAIILVLSIVNQIYRFIL